MFDDSSQFIGLLRRDYKLSKNNALNFLAWLLVRTLPALSKPDAGYEMFPGFTSPPQSTITDINQQYEIIPGFLIRDQVSKSFTLATTTGHNQYEMPPWFEQEDGKNSTKSPKVRSGPSPAKIFPWINMNNNSKLKSNAFKDALSVLLMGKQDQKNLRSSQEAWKSTSRPSFLVDLPETILHNAHGTTQQTQMMIGTNTTGNVTDRIRKLVQLDPDKFNCPEEEEPLNIGQYEVPSRRDLVLHTTTTLRKKFAGFQRKVLVFLEDIEKVISGTEIVATKCMGSKSMYRQCVKRVRAECESITRSIISSLEMQRENVMGFGQSHLCSIEDMKGDPVKLIRLLASEEASLEFALPGFLRLMSSCQYIHCRPKPNVTDIVTKPLRNANIIPHLPPKKNIKLIGPYNVLDHKN